MYCQRGGAPVDGNAVVAVGAACPASCGFCQTTTEGPKRKPNILLILADDLGTGDIPACFNAIIVHMPNLDAKGVTFKLP